MFSKGAFHKCIIFTLLLSVTFFVFSGCEKIKVADVMQSEDLGFIDTPWEIATVNGQPFESFFMPVPDEEGAPSPTSTVTSEFVFDATGKLTGELIITVSDQNPGDPPTSLNSVVTYTITGEYTTKETTLTITTQNVEVGVEITLTPREVWEQQIEGITVEQLQDDIAADSEMGYTQDESTFPFTVGVNYTQQTDQDTLTLSAPGETIVLKKKME